MKQFTIWMLLAALVLVAGCDSNKSASPVANVNEQIDLFLPESAVVGAAGVAVTVPVRVRVSNDDGAVPNIAVTFRVLDGSGEMTSRTAETDAQGLASSSMRTTLTRGLSKATIGVFTENGSAQGEVKLNGTGAPVAINIGEPPDTLVAPINAPVKISLRAQVTDAEGFGVAGIPIKYALIGQVGAETGSVSGDSLTRADGSLQFAYEVFCNGEPEEIVVSTDTALWKGEAVTDTVGVLVRTSLSQIAFLTLRAHPSYLLLPPDSMGTSEIKAFVRDVQNVGIPNIAVHFTTDLGSVAQVTSTDASGTATARFSNNFETGVAFVTATIPGTTLRATQEIRIEPDRRVGGVLEISSSRQFIYADNGLTVAHLTITLKDAEDRAIPDGYISLYAALGSVNSYALTDSMGVADAYFQAQYTPSLDEQGNLVPVEIYARNSALHLVDSCEVTIRPHNPVTLITLVSNLHQLQAGSGDSAYVRATCFFGNGEYATPGTTVQFEVEQSNGQFTNEAVEVGPYGAAASYYVAGQFVGTAVLYARVINHGEGNDSVVHSNDVQILLHSGPPSNMRLGAAPNFLNTNDPGAFSAITATVTDTSGNPVRQGEIVTFTTTMGEITPSALTDTMGRAVARLTAGVASGVAVVTGTVRLAGGGEISAVATITFIAGFPNVIELSANPLQIAAAGTGGNSTSTIRALVKDANGNPVERSTMVVFQLLSGPDEPLGCNINNRGRIDSARTANGIAVVSLNAGVQTGGVLVRVYTWRDPDSSSAGIDGLPRTDTVSVSANPVAVIAGQPSRMDIDFNSNGEDIGGGVWELEVTARVWDSHRNPCAAGVPISFTVEPEYATVDPAITDQNGIAHSHLRYNSVNTFEYITVSAGLFGANGWLWAERNWLLPLQRGRIQLAADPGNWMFDRANHDDSCQIRVWATVTDGHGVEINNAPVIFTTDRARFYWKNLRLNGRFIPFFPEVARRYTGLTNQENNEPDGVATVYLRASMDELFLDDFANELMVRMEARVDGADGVEAEPVSVVIRRH